MSRTSGRTTNGARRTMPRNSSIVESAPARPTSGLSDVVPNQNSPPPTRPGTKNARPISARRRPIDRRGGVPPVSARIGDMRAARTAGHAAPASVAISPVTSATTTAVTEYSIVETGMPHDWTARTSSTARPAPSARPPTEPPIASTRRLGEDAARHADVAGAERAQGADLPRALEDGHVEGVEDQEGADEQRDAREEVEDDVEAGELVLDLLALGLRRRDLHAASELRVESLAQSLGRGAVGGDDVDLVPDPGLVHHLARVGDRHRGGAVAAEVEPALELEEAGDPQRDDAGRGRERHAVADRQAVLGCPVGAHLDLAPSGDRDRGRPPARRRWRRAGRSRCRPRTPGPTARG